MTTPTAASPPTKLAPIVLRTPRFSETRCENEFVSLLTYDDAARGTGSTGQVMPGYIATDRGVARRNGEDAVVEHSLLDRSDVLVHNQSSLSDRARVCVPESISA
jgi:hypothetical protein